MQLLQYTKTIFSSLENLLLKVKKKYLLQRNIAIKIYKKKLPVFFKNNYQKY